MNYIIFINIDWFRGRISTKISNEYPDNICKFITWDIIGPLPQNNEKIIVLKGLKRKWSIHSVGTYLDKLYKSIFK